MYKSETNVTSSISNISIENMLDDNVYNFSIVVSNSVGNLSTSKTKFCELTDQVIFLCFKSLHYTDTTDVQIVRALPLEEDNVVMLQCMFVTGSDAIGCLVVLQFFGETDYTTVNLTRKGMHMYVMKVENLTKSSTCISEVLGYDIESNGSVGTLPIPGELSWNLNVQNCVSTYQVEDDTTSELCMRSSYPGDVLLLFITPMAYMGQLFIVDLSQCHAIIN